MEPEHIKELLTINFMEILQQNPYASQSQVVHEFIKALSDVGVEPKDKDELESLVDSCHYWIDSIKYQQYICEDCSEVYREELNDKDLGIVRKINLN